MTITQISEVLRLPVDQVLRAAQANGITCGTEDPLTNAQLDVLRAHLFRSYRPGMTPKQPPVARTPRKVIRETPPAPEPQPTPEPEPEPKPAPELAQSAPPRKKVVIWNEPVDPRMEQLVLEKKIMIDTCSLMHDKCEILIRSLIPALQKHEKKILIPEKVLDELRKHQRCVNDPHKVEMANRGMLMCRMLQKADCMSVRGMSKDNFADNTFFVALSHYRSSYHMLLITQDRGLSQDILQLNRLRSVEGYPVDVMYINSRGGLSPSRPY